MPIPPSKALKPSHIQSGSLSQSLLRDTVLLSPLFDINHSIVLRFQYTSILACSQALNIAFSVGVGRVDVFGQRLFIVAAFAERLPVVLVPEKFLVTTMRNDVIHHCCPDILALLGTLHTERMCFEIRLPGFLPTSVISTLCCRPGSFWLERQVLLTVEPAGFHQLRAAGMMARRLWFVRHNSYCSLRSQ